MQNQPTCRCCLAVEGKLFNILAGDEAQLYLDAVGVAVLPSDQCPKHVCVFCRRMLQKIAAFRARCHKALVVFYLMLNQGKEETSEYNRLLTSNYSELKPQYLQTETLTLELPAAEKDNELNVNLQNLLEVAFDFKADTEEEQTVKQDIDRESCEQKEESSEDAVYLEIDNEEYLEEIDSDSVVDNSVPKVFLKP